MMTRQAPLLPVLIIFLCLCNVCSSSATNKTTTTRQEKVFSLFSIVQFPNSACTSSSSTYSNGTCFTSSECSSKGGTAQGNCAAGFGVCCIFSVSATSSTISENCTYIVNPSYPSNYVPTTTPSTVSYTISKSQSDVCRIRLDYDLFVLTTPLAAATTQGQCANEVFKITTTAESVAPSVTTYGAYPALCGTNTGLHSYIDLSCTTTDTATLAFTIGDAVDNQWKIKVTQYSCSDDCVASQEGCFQYFTGLTGTIQSYNLAQTAQLQGHNYKNCIRQEEGYCCIQYTVNSYAMDATACAAAATRCSGASICTSDYIIIPNTVPSGSISYDRFCGVNLNADGFPATNQPIVSCTLPFEVSHVTNIASVGGPAGIIAEDGFSLTYSQVAGNC